MKQYLIITLVALCAVTSLHSQTREEKIALRKQRVQQSKDQNKMNELTSAQEAEIRQLSSEAFTLMNYLQRSETLEETQAYYAQTNPQLFEQFRGLVNNYKEQGISSNILNNQSYMVDTQIPEFLNSKAYEILKGRYDEVKQQFMNANSPTSNDKTKEMALERWQLLAEHTSFFEQYMSYDARLESLNAKVQSEIGKLQGSLEAKYAAYVTTPIHKKYREKVVLSYTPIVYGKENEAAFLEEVVIDGAHAGLYFMYYSNVPNKDYLKDTFGKKKEHVHAQLQFEDNIGYSISNGCLVFYDKAYDLSDTEENQAYLSLPMVPSLENYKRDKWLDPTYYRFLQCLLEKELDTPHTARLLFGFPGTTKTFQKDFTITITQEGYAQLQKMMERIDYEKLKDIRMGKPGAMHNGTNIALVKQEAAKKGMNVKRVVITGNQFKVYKNSHYPYEIKNKACNAELAFEENGKCYVYEFQIVQEYQGGGSYGKPFAAFSWGGKHQILCENVQK